ncbi:MAG: DUF1801 domain-containing protein [Bryobacteraceae bacterium]
MLTDSAPLNPIVEYARSQTPALGDLCDKLQAEIDGALPDAASRIWHGGPVWFVGENPVVGYTVRTKRVDLMFWSGQLFDEPRLTALGKDQAAQIGIRDKSEISLPELSRWLTKARTIIFDYAGVYARKRGTRSA